MNRERMDIAPPVTVGSSRDIASPPAVVVTGVDFRNGTLTGDVIPTMQAHHCSTSVNATPHVLTFDARGNGEGTVTNTLTGDHNRRVTDYTALVFDVKQSGEASLNVAPTLRAMSHANSHMNGGGQLGVVTTAYAIGSHAGCADGSVSNTSHASGGPVGLNISANLAYTLRADRQQSVVYSAVSTESQEPDDTLVFDVAQITHPENRSVIEPNRPCPSISAESRLHVARMRAFGDYQEDGTFSALKARDYKDATDLVFAINNDTRSAVDSIAHPLRAGSREQQAVAWVSPVTFGVPRRLLPIECERLMSWPDNYTNVPDEKGKPAADSQRYKVIGNGVVSNVAEWIALRILRAHA